MEDDIKDHVRRAEGRCVVIDVDYLNAHLDHLPITPTHDTANPRILSACTVSFRRPFALLFSRVQCT